MKILKSSMLILIISALALSGCANSEKKSTPAVTVTNTDNTAAKEKDAAKPVETVDSDKDGIPDTLDKQNDTPGGAKVDADGIAIDSDKDGAPDGIDKQDNTPNGAKVDADGIAIDSDKDGVPDGIDKQDSTPSGLKVDADGIAIDSDKDGVPDGIDKQDNTPNGAKVDADGVAIDSDKDGVPDGIDKDNSTLEGVKVDADGITLDTDKDGLADFIDADSAVSVDKTIEANGKQFFVIINNITDDDSFLAPIVQLDLEMAAKVALTNNFKLGFVITLQSSGDKKTDLAVSTARISAVKNFLISKGITEKNITASSKLETISLNKKLEKIKVIISK